MKVLPECQQNLHKWGAANRVVFDPAKEEFVVIRRQHPIGNDFKLLGVTFDAQLSMRRGARKIAIEAGWRLQSILRTSSVFTTPEMVKLYKSNVLSFIESCSCGYFHASKSALACVDKVQSRFLREIGLTNEQVLLDYRLAPLQTRRAIAMLGFLHRIVLGQVSQQIRELFPRAEAAEISDAVSSRTRGGLTSRHDKRFVHRIQSYSTDQFRRSAFGMVQCYNALPQRIVDVKTVKLFQRHLQMALVDNVQRGAREEWQEVFSDGRRYSSPLRFQAFFR